MKNILTDERMNYGNRQMDFGSRQRNGHSNRWMNYGNRLMYEQKVDEWISEKRNERPGWHTIWKSTQECRPTVNASCKRLDTNLSLCL